MEAHLHRASGSEWLRRIVPNQGGALGIGLIVLAVAGIDGRRWSARTRNLILIQAAG